VRLRPDHAEAHNDLGVALIDTGRLEEAIVHFEKALQLAPDFPDARYDLDVARAMRENAAKTAADRPAGDRPSE